MSEDLHQVRFTWPHTEPSTVIVTGTFDQWSSSIHLTKTPTGFEGTTRIPWSEKIKFKFIVDGQWIVHEGQPTETDPGGFVNNVYTAPAPPVLPPPPVAEEPVIAEASKPVDPTPNGYVANGGSVVSHVVDEKPAAGVKESAESPAAPAPEKAKPAPADVPKEEGKTEAPANLASTIVARDGTSSALDYVASGFGAAMHSVVGVDPINVQKIAIPTPKPDDKFTLPDGGESTPNTAALPPTAEEKETPESLPSPIAPIVPIMIVPVNAAENNTVAPEETAVPAPVPEVTPQASSLPEATVAPPAQEELVKVEEPSTHGAVTTKAESPAVAEIAAEEKPVGAIPSPSPATEKAEPAPKVEEVLPEPAAAEPEPTPAVVSEPATEVETSPAQAKEEPTSAPAPVAAAAAAPAVPAVEEVVPEVKPEAAVAEVASTPAVKETKEEAVVPQATPEPIPVAVVAPVAEPATETPAVAVPAVEESTATPAREIAAPEPAPAAVEEKKAEESVAAPTPTAPGPATSTEATPIKEEAAPAVNGTTSEAAAEVKETPAAGGTTTPPAAEPAALPATPAKKEQFPSTSESTNNSPSSSKFNSTRKKRTSIFGKIKNIFHADKEKEKEKK